MREFIFVSDDLKELYGCTWNGVEGAKGVVQIAHGMAEMSSRYKGFAEELNRNGYIVYANDHRGHGKTAKSVEKVGILGDDCFNMMVNDMKKLNDIIKNEHPSLPIFLFGHSMGSLLSQRYMVLHGDTVKGVILCGTTGRQGSTLDMGIILSKLEMLRIGKTGRSKLLNALTFGGYNSNFKPKKTNFDWLTRDEKEVEKYINDPFCGGIFSASFFHDFLSGIKKCHDENEIAKIPKNLPILFIAGEMDPVGKCCKTIKTLIEEYKEIGIKDIEYKFYKDCRHELLNELNKDEVMKDAIAWLDNHIKSR